MMGGGRPLDRIIGQGRKKTPQPCDRSHSGAVIASLNARLEQGGSHEFTTKISQVKKKVDIRRIKFYQDNVTRNYTRRKIEKLMAEALAYLDLRKALR